VRYVEQTFPCRVVVQVSLWVERAVSGEGGDVLWLDDWRGHVRHRVIIANGTVDSGVVINGLLNMGKR